MTRQLFEGIKVLELGTMVGVPYSGKIFADYGADVLKVEPLEGDPSRSEGPFLKDIPNKETSALFLHLNTNKRSITCDLSTASGKDIVRSLIDSYDIVIENFNPGTLESLGLGYEAVTSDRTDLVMGSLTSFGQTGPWKDFKGSELVLQAMAGPMHMNGDPTKEPIKLGGNLAHYHAGLSLTYACILARLRVERGGSGDHIDQSVYEAQAGFRDRRAPGLTSASYTGRSNKRGGSLGRTASGPRPAQDGYANIMAGTSKHVPAFLRLIGREDLAEHPDAKKPAPQMSTTFIEEMEASYAIWLIERTKREAVAATQSIGILGGAILTVEDLLNDPHYQERNVWEEVDHPETGSIRYPGRHFVTSGATRKQMKRAPLLGEHTFSVLTDMGYTNSDIVQLHRTKVV